MNRIWSLLKDRWCYIMHPAPMWPVNGFYRCPSCQREYPVPWEQNVTRAETGARQPESEPVSQIVAQPARGGLRLIKVFRKTAA
jgi:hypothetical protein